MKTNDGGPGFPMPSGLEPRVDQVTHYNEGMTIRAYIATHAMTGLLQNSQYAFSQVAKSAVSFADALIAELETKQEE